MSDVHVETCMKAYIAAWFLTLEYAVSGSAVARRFNMQHGCTMDAA